MRTPSGHEVYAMGAEYPSPAALYEAAKMVRDAGFKRWDVFSPFPIHGMDEAMGLGKSWLSAVVLAGGTITIFVLVDGSQAFQCALCTTKVTTPNISKSGWFVTSIGWYFEFSGRKYIFGYIFHSLLSVNLFPSLATTIFLWAAVTDRSTTITSPG